MLLVNPQYFWMTLLHQHRPLVRRAGVPKLTFGTFRAESTLVLHGVNTAFELFAIMKGRRLHSSTPTKVPMSGIMEKMGYDTALQPAFPQAFFDRLENRYVISWASAYESTEDDATVRAPLFVCASHGNNPMYEWTCWALYSVPKIHPNVEHCAGQSSGNFWPAYPQVSGVTGSLTAAVCSRQIIKTEACGEA